MIIINIYFVEELSKWQDVAREGVVIAETEDKAKELIKIYFSNNIRIEKIGVSTRKENTVITISYD